MSKHTPGPWDLADVGDYGDFDGQSQVILDADNTQRLAVVHVSDEGGRANARLIAAAPDMLDALRKSERLHALVEQIAHAYRGHLPHENAGGEFVSGNPELSADTRTRLALIEDAVAKSDSILIEADEAIAKAEGRDGDAA